MKTIYLIRHGQSQGNIAPIHQGTTSPLSTHGQQQAKEIAARTKNISFEALISSPSTRAQQTAEAISSETGVHIETSELFQENRKPISMLEKHREDPQVCAIAEQYEKSIYTPSLRVEDGENFDDLILRASNALAYLEQRPEKSIVVVTHSFFLRILVAQVLLGQSFSPENLKNLRIHSSAENTGLTVLRYDPTISFWKLWVFNDHAHLG